MTRTHTLLVLAATLLAACRSAPAAHEERPRVEAPTEGEDAPVPQASAASPGVESPAEPDAEPAPAAPAPEPAPALGPDPDGGVVLEIAGRPAFLALPRENPPRPALLVVREAGRIGSSTRELARRLAEEGFAALALDLAAPRPGHGDADEDEARVEALRDLAAARRFLAADERVRASRIGALGFGSRGGLLLELALVEPSIRALALVYTPLVTEPEYLLPLRAEVIGLFGSRDVVVPSDRVADFAETLRATGKAHAIRMYDAAHGFADPRSPNHDPSSRRAVWEELRAFFGRTMR